MGREFVGLDGEVEPGAPEQSRGRRAPGKEVRVFANVAQEAEGEVPARRVPRQDDARGGNAELEDEMEVRAQGVLQSGGEASARRRREAVFDEEDHGACGSHQRLGRSRTVRVPRVREHEAAPVEMQNHHSTPIVIRFFFAPMMMMMILPRIPRPARRGRFDLRVQKRAPPVVELALLLRRDDDDGGPALLLRPGIQHGLRERELDCAGEREPGAEECVREALAEGVAGVGT